METSSMDVQQWSIERIKPYPNNPRINDDAVEAVAASIRKFGFRQPIVVDEEGVIVCGHTRWKAAQLLEMDEVPVHVAKDLTPEQIQAYRLADNRTSELSQWDNELLPIELAKVEDAEALGFDEASFSQLLERSLVELRQMDTKPPPRMTWVLIGIPTVRFGDIAEGVEAIAALDQVVCETTVNDEGQNDESKTDGAERAGRPTPAALAGSDADP